MQSLVNIFKIMSDETRLRIIMLLAQQELCVCELCGILNVSQPKISKNLSKLRDVNLVIDERSEKYVFYKLRTENKVFMRVVKDVQDVLEDYPQLVLDKSRITDKELYLKQCSNLKSEEQTNML